MSPQMHTKVQNYKVNIQETIEIVIRKMKALYDKLSLQNSYIYLPVEA
jgi:hypothetical protein